MNECILFVASVLEHVRAFHIPYLEMLRAKGYRVMVAGRYDRGREDIEARGFTCIDVPFSRNPVDPQNIRAYNTMREVFARHDEIRLAHVHTPVAAFVTRMAAASCEFRGKMLYTAHGFHFYNGAGIPNWLVFYPLEVMAARYTDGLITINREDYDRALRFRLKAGGAVHYVPGVGLNLHLYERGDDLTRREVRRELGVAANEVVIICVAELNRNKNQIQLLRAVESDRDGLAEIRVVIVGDGPCRAELEGYVNEQGLAGKVQFLGYRTDIPRLLKAADIASLPSFREGLSRFLMEAAACQLPLLCTNTRGNRDIVAEGVNGYLVPCGDYIALAGRIRSMARDEGLRQRMGAASAETAKRYSLDQVAPVMDRVYTHYLGEQER